MTPRLKARDGGRFAVFAVGGGIIAVGGFVLLYALVAAGMAAGLAYAIQLLLTLAANYLFTRHVTFRDRRAPMSAVQVSRFAATRGATLLGGWLLFMAQVHAIGVPYLLAYTICLGSTSVVNFVTSDAYVFAEAATPVRVLDRPAPPASRDADPIPGLLGNRSS
jgi:putative flippase GtrA